MQTIDIRQMNIRLFFRKVLINNVRIVRESLGDLEFESISAVVCHLGGCLQEVALVSEPSQRVE
jgi:hypothetical protein